MQVTTPDEMRGRVFAVNSLFAGTSDQLGWFRAGMMAAWLGAVGSVAIGGVGAILTVVVVVLALSRLAARPAARRGAILHRVIIGVEKQRAERTLTDTLRQTLADAGKVLVIEGQDDFVAGHISARLPGQPNRFLMKPANIGLEEMEPDDLLTIDLDGEVVAGTAPRHNEVYVHSEILRARPDVNCVVHTHPVYAIVFSSLDQPLVPVSNEGVMFHNALPVFSEVTDVITTSALGNALARCLGDKRAVLLRNHGIVTTGTTVEEAVWIALKLERACQMQLLAMSAGGPKVLHIGDLEKGKARRVSRTDLHASVFNLLVRRWQRGQFSG